MFCGGCVRKCKGGYEESACMCKGVGGKWVCEGGIECDGDGICVWRSVFCVSLHCAWEKIKLKFIFRLTVYSLHAPF